MQNVYYSSYAMFIFLTVVIYYSTELPLTYYLADRLFGRGILCIGYSVAEWIYLTRPQVNAIFKAT